MTNKISMDKKYRTRSGIKIRRVLCVDRNHPDWPVLYEAENGALIACTASGQCLKDFDGDYDLIEILPYEDFKIDDPVMVKLHHQFAWGKRYFAGVNKDGQPLAFQNGRTSWSSGEQRDVWDECRKPTAEELAK